MSAERRGVAARERIWRAVVRARGTKRLVGLLERRRRAASIRHSAGRDRVTPEVVLVEGPALDAGTGSIVTRLLAAYCYARTDSHAGPGSGDDTTDRSTAIERRKQSLATALPALAPMLKEMERAPAIVRPSAFWEAWNEQNLQVLSERGFSEFKRTINHNYFNWVTRSPLDDQFRVVARDWLRRRGGLAPLHVRLPDADGLDLMPTWLQRRTHAVFLALLWEYVHDRDSRGLLDTLEEPELGNPISVQYRGRRVGQDLSNSVHEITSMLEGTPSEWSPGRVIELGGGYGRVAWAMLRTFPAVQYILVDIPPALAVAERYLTELFADRRVFRFRSFEDPAEVTDELGRAEIVFLTPNQLDLLAPLKADLFVNISSLHEMRPEQIAHYLATVDTHCSGRFYTKQWQSWYNPNDGVLIDRGSYPIPDHWATIYSRVHPIQVEFFEALYWVGG